MTCGCGGRRPSMVLATVEKSAASLEGEVVSLELLLGKSVGKSLIMFAFESMHINHAASLLESLMSDKIVNKSRKHPGTIESSKLFAIGESDSSTDRQSAAAKRHLSKVI